MTKQINDAAYWREFDNNELTHSAAHYLMAIDSLRDELGYARVTDVAKKLSVSRGAASMSIANLKKRGWVTGDPNRMLLLAGEGASIVNLVEHSFRILTHFFTDVLGLPKDIAFADACKMEHLMNLETSKHILLLMQFLEADPQRTLDLHAFMSSGGKDCEGVASCPICEGECLATATFGKEDEELS